MMSAASIYIRHAMLGALVANSPFSILEPFLLGAMDAARNSADARPGADEILVAMVERMRKTPGRIKSHISMMQIRIHRFPRGLRGAAGEDGCYMAPSVVAIGPYHHGLPHLQDMEEVKHAAAHSFCEAAGPGAITKVYDAMLSVAGDARRCYAPGDAAVARLGDAELAAMMLLDGCFLLQFMGNSAAPLFAGCALSSGPAILMDMMLLENQLPWLVLEALMASASVEVDVHGFVAGMVDKYFPKKIAPRWRRVVRRLRTACGGGGGPAAEGASAAAAAEDKPPPPPHLLGLLRSSLIRGMPAKERAYRAGSSSLLSSSSAVKLAQIGVMPAPSTAAWFADMRLRKNPVLGELALSPLFLDDVTASWLVNVAALEASTAASCESDGVVVSSYLSVLAMLMDRKEDVHELRGRGVLRGHFSNTQTLAFFKGLGRRLRLGGRYVVVLEQIEAYKRNRPVRIAVHRFLYKNSKIIAAVLSIAGVVVGIFKALLSLKTGRGGS
ncbi:hypothetical protein ACP4OV_017452 [Aristida adscensionis]